MQKPSHVASPSVRIQTSTPTSTAHTRPMLAQPNYPGAWGDAYTGAYLSALPKNMQDPRFHKRGSSDSSIASAGPPSPLSHNTLYPQIATSDPHFPPSFDFDYHQAPQSAHTSKSLPTPTTDAMMYRSNNPYAALDMRRNLSTGADERASYAMSGPQSISSMTQNSPATPHTNYDAEYDDSKNAYNGFPTAAYQQSLQDVFPDHQTYSPGVGYNRAQQSLHRLSIQSQRSSMMADRLHAAQQDHLRTDSPTLSSREKSPFRQNSPYMPTNAQRQQALPHLQKQRTSISPKELMLDEREIEEPSQPLFAEQPQQPFFGQQRRPQSNLANFYVPTLESDPSTMQAQHQFQMFANGYRQGQSGIPDMTPEFPAHLVSMESTADESVSEPSSQQSNTPQKPQPRTSHPAAQPSARPVDTSSDAGTYSCTYHGCTLRFDTPTKLQKHKREGHRQLSPGAAQVNLALRNSQAGPHRCDRINPSTGKPCNSVFSRPYDLTRHEDTIHNARKQKVRCPYCTEEKTFSRADALTRHLRVVHPDVQPQMKQRRARK